MKLNFYDPILGDFRDRSAYQSAKHYERMKFILEHLGGKCVKCGATERLEVDHIDKSSKKYNVGQRARYSIETLKSELAKCQLLCYSCHRTKSGKERDRKAFCSKGHARTTENLYRNGCRQCRYEATKRNNKRISERKALSTYKAKQQQPQTK